MSIINSLFVEKYRPKNLDELTLPEDYRKDFLKMIHNKDIPHLLLYGPPGGGKTALSLILASRNGILEFPDENLLHINGSSKEGRSIGFVDNVVEPYLKIPPAGNDKYKIIFIDEADGLTSASLDSLKAIMEKYSLYGRFIFTCNYVSKISEAIRSRTTDYEFKQVPIEYVLDYCRRILNSEKISFDEKDLRFICDVLYPDIRRIVNTIQKNSSDGTLRTSRESVLTVEKLIITSVVEIISFAKVGDNKKVSDSINNLINILNKHHDVNYRSIYSELFFMKEIQANNKIIINKYSNSHNDCLVPAMHFTSMCFDIIRSIYEYNKMKVKK